MSDSRALDDLGRITRRRLMVEDEADSIRDLIDDLAKRLQANEERLALIREQEAEAWVRVGEATDERPE